MSQVVQETYLKNIGVTHINIPQNKNDKQIFSITASNEIAKFQEIESDNDEIVIDIYYAQKEILTDDIEVETSDIVNDIISLQYDEHDISITRIIFKLKAQYQYDIELNDDENGIVVYFGKKKMTIPIIIPIQIIIIIIILI